MSRLRETLGCYVHFIQKEIQEMNMYGVIGLVFCLMVLISADVETKQVKKGLITERIR